MEKILKFIDKVLGLDLIAQEISWWVYCAGTQEERLRYEYGKLKGYHCTRIIRDSQGITQFLEYDRNRKPEREYLTKEEYFELNYK